MFRITFSNGLWSRFSETIRKILFFESSNKYDFGLGYKDVKTVCQYYKDQPTKIALQKILEDNKLIGGSNFTTVANIMGWLNKTYPSSTYYTFDKGDTWNKPMDTLESFKIRESIIKEMPNFPISIHQNSLAWKNCTTTDCDDYAIILYSLCRVAGIPQEEIYLCWIKTETEWHMNAMYFSNGVPYALEGTYYPEKAIKNFGRENYFNIPYYTYVKWIFNEDKVFRYSDKINPLGTV